MREELNYPLCPRPDFDSYNNDLNDHKPRSDIATTIFEFIARNVVLSLHLSSLSQTRAERF